ncbi:hypothetical protein Bhyg_09243 [Pseudolycoriella hygida]|uniref:Uncharacterized protein n=1 Tax=Pseudolycoriella hygida TaxID=35572 RepID=A0A9Q0N757_9DIPT|nr:hypothetical protein Bhyg_09243 [Pseudolycoriella hygida]
MTNVQQLNFLALHIHIDNLSQIEHLAFQFDQTVELMVKMKSHSWLILLVVLCTTLVDALPSSTTNDVEENSSTKAKDGNLFQGPEDFK